jgi:hypothetical protein
MGQLLVFLVIVIAVIVLIIEYWYIALPLFAVGVAIFIIRRMQAEEAKRLAAEEARREAERRRLESLAAEQRQLRSQLAAFNRDAAGRFESMPAQLARAERHLNAAERDYLDRAFAPFWDNVEGAVKMLGVFDDHAKQINTLAVRYAETAKRCEGSVPAFTVDGSDVQMLSVSRSTAGRMREIVRRAQCDFQFASIYEQRKTNQILVAGFRSLAQALDGIGRQIVESLESLQASVNAVGITLADSMGAVQGEVARAAQLACDHHDDMLSIASDAAASREEAMQMLDNIQRRRKPSEIAPR